MPTDRTIPVDDRFFRWLIIQISWIQRGSIQLEIENGQVRSIGCYGHRYVYSLDDAPELMT